MATPRAAAALILAASGAAAAQEIQAPAPAAETTAASLANPVETRFRLLPPTANPAFAGGPAPPPAGKNYGLALAEVIGIDALIWGIDYAMGKPYVKISAASISQNFKKDWIEANVAASIDAYEDDDMDGLPDPLG